MSKFSDQLNLCVQSSGSSKNQLIEICKINRSTFYQFLKGERLLAEPALDAVLNALQLPPSEEERLRKLYDIAQIGEDIYASRQCCAKCLENLAQMTHQNQTAIHEFTGQTQMTVSKLPLIGKERVFQEVCHLVQAEMFRAEPQIDLFLPQDADTILEYLRSFFQKRESRTIRMRQIVQFSQNQESKTREVLVFFNSNLLYTASPTFGYESYYYYADGNLTDTIGAMYPYCILTSTGVMLVNARMDRALFSATPNIIYSIREHFKEVLGRTKPFLQNWRGDQEDAWDAFCHYMNSSTEGYQYFYAPRFSNYMTQESITHCTAPAGIPLLEAQFRRSQSEEEYVCFCTAEGIWDFARNGCFQECPDGKLPAITPTGRRLILEEMLYHPRTSKPVYLLDPTKLAVSKEVLFSMSRYNRIFLQRRRMEGGQIYTFRERNLLEAFDGYFQALCDSDAVLPPASLNQVLRECIRYCRALENPMMK